MTLKDQDIPTNEEYEPIDEALNEIDGKDGDPLDPIEQNQSEDDYAGEGGTKQELREALTDDRDTKDDE